MAKSIDLSTFKEAKKEVTEILFEAPAIAAVPPQATGRKARGANKDVQIAFYLTKEDSARLNIIHAKLQAQTGIAISRADRIRNLVLAFIEENENLS